jgi:hypothetical protein
MLGDRRYVGEASEASGAGRPVGPMSSGVARVTGRAKRSGQARQVPSTARCSMISSFCSI